MPSKEFMQQILGTESAQRARGEVPLPEVEASEEPLEELLEEEELPEAEEAEDEQPEEGEVAEEGEEEEEPLPEDERTESDEEPQAEHEQGDFYLGRYRTKEEAERGLEETRRLAFTKSEAAAEAQRRAEEAERRLAYYEGRESVRSETSGGDFDEWADEQVSENPQEGLRQAIQFARETDDERYVWAYLERWGKVDPYAAGTVRDDLREIQRQTPGPVVEEPAATQEDLNAVIAPVWVDFAEGMDEETRYGIGDLLKETTNLKSLVIRGASLGDIEVVRSAFVAARDIYSKSKGPRRVRSSDAARLQEEKRAATVAQGDGAPPRRRAAEQQMSEIELQGLEGAARLGLKRRDE